VASVIGLLKGKSAIAVSLRSFGSSRLRPG
jgi:hypothetical protein